MNRPFLILVYILVITFQVFSQQPPLKPGVSQELAQWRAANYSNVRYKLNLTLEKGAPLMKGTIEITVDLTEEAAKNDLILDWRAEQFRNDKDKPYAHVTSLNGQVPLVIEVAEHLRVSRQYLKTGENIIKIEFASPIKTSGTTITRYVDQTDGSEYIYAQFAPNKITAFPVFDQPDLKARFQLTINCPDRWKAISNTKYKSVSSTIAESFPPNKIESKSWYNFEFEETQPISTYVFAFSCGEFKEFIEDTNLPVDETPKEFWTEEKLKQYNNHEKSRIYVRKSQAEKLKNAKPGSAGIPACNERESANNNVNKRAKKPKQTLAGRDACAPIEEFFRLNRKTSPTSVKLDFVILPSEVFKSQTDYDGLRFINEDSFLKQAETPTGNTRKP